MPERLFPAVRTLADGIFQVGPEFPQDRVGVVDIAGEAARALAAQIRPGNGRNRIALALAPEQAQVGARVEEPRQSIRLHLQIGRELVDACRLTGEPIKHPQRQRRKHDLGAAKRLDQFQDGGRIGVWGGRRH